MAKFFAMLIIALTMVVAGDTQPAYAISHQTQRVTTKCFPKKLWGIIHYIKRKTKRKVIITSGYRKRGRRGSQHRFCRAADIRVPGVPIRRLKEIARTAPGIGGIGTYRRKSILHLDVGPRREWTH